MKAFAKRTLKEIYRDPLTLFFGIIFPSIILLLLSAIQANVPTDLFNIQLLSPGIIVFGMSFITLFSAMLLSKDRSSTFLIRLYTTPLTEKDFILGYIIPMFPVAIAQSAVCFILSIILGLKISVGILCCILGLIPICILFISLGLLCGSVLNDKQVGGICGALLTNLTAWFSGAWFDVSMVGGLFKKISDILPFYHAVTLERELLSCNFSNIMPHFCNILIYTVIITVIAIILFKKQMKI